MAGVNEVTMELMRLSMGLEGSRTVLAVLERGVCDHGNKVYALGPTFGAETVRIEGDGSSRSTYCECASIKLLVDVNNDKLVASRKFSLETGKSEEPKMAVMEKPMISTGAQELELSCGCKQMIVSGTVYHINKYIPFGANELWENRCQHEKRAMMTDTSTGMTVISEDGSNFGFSESYQVLPAGGRKWLATGVGQSLKFGSPGKLSTEIITGGEPNRNGMASMTPYTNFPSWIPESIRCFAEKLSGKSVSMKVRGVDLMTHVLDEKKRIKSVDRARGFMVSKDMLLGDGNETILVMDRSDERQTKFKMIIQMWLAGNSKKWIENWVEAFRSCRVSAAVELKEMRTIGESRVYCEEMIESLERFVIDVEFENDQECGVNGCADCKNGMAAAIEWDRKLKKECCGVNHKMFMTCDELLYGCE